MLARIFTRQHDGLRELSDKLEAAGYEVEVWAPGRTPSSAADLNLSLETMPADAALQAAQLAATQTGADVFVAPGAIEAVLAPRDESRPVPEHQIDTRSGEAFPWTEQPEVQLAAEVQPPAMPFEPVHNTHTGRITGAFAAWQERRMAAAEEKRRVQAERAKEREQQREAEQFALQQRLEEERKAEVERQRLAAEEMARQAERERMAREEMARQAAQAAERERVAREQTARIAALRTEQERLAREEMERQAAVVARREREARDRLEREAALAREGERRVPEAIAGGAVERGGESRTPRVPPAATLPCVSVAQHSRPQASASAVVPPPIALPRPRTEVYPARRIPSMRDRRWHQAAFMASVAALVVMLGFGAALNIGKSSPIPSNLLQNGVQQQTPFGPATLAANPQPASPAKPHSGNLKAARAQQHRTNAPKPSPQVSPRRPAARDSSEQNDEVIVRHYPPARTNTAQTRTDGVKRFSDIDK